MSVYLICVSNNLDKQAVILAEDYKKHWDMFKELQTKMKVILRAIKTKFTQCQRASTLPRCTSELRK